jgi:hypothetical protein
MSMFFTQPRSALAGATTASQDCASVMVPTITLHTSSTLMGYRIEVHCGQAISRRQGLPTDRPTP